MKRAENPNSAQARLMAFFDANPDEYLTVEDVALKLSVSLSTARNAVMHLKSAGKPIATDTFIFRKAAD